MMNDWNPDLNCVCAQYEALSVYDEGL